MMILILAVLGLAFGSFANACTWRLHERGRTIKAAKSKKANAEKSPNLSIVSGRSVCTHCGHVLAARDLVPVASFIWLRGKCRYCGKPIDDTPFAELLTPALFIISYIFWPYGLSGNLWSLGNVLFAFWLVFLVGFVILALYDLKWFLLPDKVVYPLAALALLQLLINVFVFGGGWQSLVSAIWGIIFTAGLFYGIYFISRGVWIGFGDVKLSVILGLIVGGPLNGLSVIFIASLIGTVAALPTILQKKSGLTTRIPFGPWLMAATLVVVLFGAHITAWYNGLFYMQ